MTENAHLAKKQLTMRCAQNACYGTYKNVVSVFRRATSGISRCGCFMVSKKC